MTLTRKSLLKSCKPEVHTVDIAGVGKVFVRSLTELQRSRRLAEMFDGNGNLTTSAKQKRRVHMIIDQLCEDADGTPMFSEGDVGELMGLDGVKLDPYIEAIQAVNEPAEKNGKAE